MHIQFINAVLDMHKNEAILLQIIRRIGNKHYVDLVSNLDIHAVPRNILLDEGKHPSLYYITVLQ